MQFSFATPLIAGVSLGVLVTVSLTLYLNGVAKASRPVTKVSHKEGLKILYNFSPRTARNTFDLLLPSGGVEKAGLARFRGEVVVVNFWATWCAPCRREMPLFDALQARYADAPVRVLALALDRGSADKPIKFLADLNIEHLTQAHDPSYASARAVGLIGLPTTLVLDVNGREIGRLAGEADWNSPAVHALLDAELEKIEAAD